MRQELLTSLLFQVGNEGQSGHLSPLGRAGVDLPDKSGYIHTVESWEEVLQDAGGGYLWDDASFEFLLGTVIF